jgi:hypothetical protein
MDSGLLFCNGSYGGVAENDFMKYFIFFSMAYQNPTTAWDMYDINLTD